MQHSKYKCNDTHIATCILITRHIFNILFHMWAPLLHMEVLNAEDALEVVAKGFADINRVYFAFVQWHLKECLETI